MGRRTSGAPTRWRGAGTPTAARAAAVRPLRLLRRVGGTPFEIRHFFYLGGNVQTPLASPEHLHHRQLRPALTSPRAAHTNGDTLSPAPGLRHDLSKPASSSPRSALSTEPRPGQRLIPRNLGQARASCRSTRGGAGGEIRQGDPAGGGDGAATVWRSGEPRPPAGRRSLPPSRPSSGLTRVFSIYAINVRTARTRGTRGNMSSPYFLKSNNASTMFIFGPGGGGSAGNRSCCCGCDSVLMI